MEDEDLGVGVRHLDHERVQQVIGVASLVQIALELGDVPEKDKADLNLTPIFFSTSIELTWQVEAPPLCRER